MVHLLFEKELGRRSDREKNSRGELGTELCEKAEPNRTKRRIRPHSNISSEKVVGAAMRTFIISN